MSPSNNPFSIRETTLFSEIRCPFCTASNKMQSSKVKELFSFSNLVYVSLIVLPYIPKIRNYHPIHD